MSKNKNNKIQGSLIIFDYNELCQDGLFDVYTNLNNLAAQYTWNIESVSELINLGFIDFYDSLSDELKVSIQFSLILKTSVQRNFEIYKRNRISEITYRLIK